MLGQYIYTLIFIQLRGIDLRDARGLDVGFVSSTLDSEIRSTTIACRELLAVNIDEDFAGTRIAGLQPTTLEANVALRCSAVAHFHLACFDGEIDIACTAVYEFYRVAA